MPNAGPKRFLAGTIAVSLVVIYAVHYQQNRDRREMHKGVLKDRERVAAKKALKQMEEQEKKKS